MDTKTLLSALIGFFIGGLLVSVAATTFNKPAVEKNNEMTMSEMVTSLKGKKGDKYDKAFIASMIDHHQSAVGMAELSAKNAKHGEIKQLSNDIITAQKKEIFQMKQWQSEWGYDSKSDSEHAVH